MTQGETDVPRIDVESAHRDLSTGRALLVCAYADEAKCRQLRLDGSISLSELERKLASVTKDKELIFYCG